MGKGKSTKTKTDSTPKEAAPSSQDDDKKPDNLQTTVPIYYENFLKGVRESNVDDLKTLGEDLRRDLPEQVWATVAPGDDFKKYSATKGSNYIRRLCHVLASVACVYYFFGPGLFGIPKDILLFIALSVVPLTIDTLRIKRGWKVFGIRDHERDRIASYVWFTHGSLILILICPQQIAVPVILAASIGDPLIGEIRRFRRSIAFSVGIIFIFLVFFIYGYSIPMAIVGGLICFIGEATEFGYRWSLRRDLFYSRHLDKEHWLAKYSTFMTKTDDDFTMQFFPGMVLLVIYFMQPAWFPEPLIEPIGFLAGLA